MSGELLGAGGRLESRGSLAERQQDLEFPDCLERQRQSASKSKGQRGGAQMAGCSYHRDAASSRRGRGAILTVDNGQRLRGTAGRRVAEPVEVGPVVGQGRAGSRERRNALQSPLPNIASHDAPWNSGKFTGDRRGRSGRTEAGRTEVVRMTKPWRGVSDWRAVAVQNMDCPRLARAAGKSGVLATRSSGRRAGRQACLLACLLACRVEAWRTYGYCGSYTQDALRRPGE